MFLLVCELGLGMANGAGECVHSLKNTFEHLFCHCIALFTIPYYIVFFLYISPAYGHPTLFILGGVDKQWSTGSMDIINNQQFVSDSVKVVDLFGDNLTSLFQPAQLPERRFGSGIAVYGNDIFLIGGASVVVDIRTTKSEKTLWKYETSRNKWKMKAPMNEGRNSPCTLIISDKLFAVGGWSTEYLHLDTVEKYDIKSNRWSYDTPLPYALDDSPGCVVNGKGYIIGGLLRNETASRNILVLTYEHEKIIWEVIHDILPKGLSFHTATTDGTTIYISLVDK